MFWLKLICLLVLSFPLSHIVMKKAIMLDMGYDQKKSRLISKLFYIPVINFIFSFSYLIWSVITFKRY